jgi:hypothetical protein
MIYLLDPRVWIATLSFGSFVRALFVGDWPQALYWISATTITLSIIWGMK